MRVLAGFSSQAGKKIELEYRVIAVNKAGQGPAEQYGDGGFVIGIAKWKKKCHIWKLGLAA